MKVGSVLIALVLASCAPDAPKDKTAEQFSASPTAASPVVQEDPAPFSEDALEPFSKKLAMDHVRYIANKIGVRVRGSEGERAAARYIAGEYRALGYNVNIQKFPVDGGTSRNVVAWWPGARRYPVVVGGHMDTVPGAPGANDNASGVAVTLEIARLVAGKEPARWLRFVAFGSEENGADGNSRYGSQAFVNKLGEEGQAQLAGAVSVDMVADGRPLLVADADIGPPAVGKLLYNIGLDLGIEMAKHSCDCSDHGPFEHAGISAASLWSGDEPDYHSASDTVPNMFPADLLRTGRVVRAFAARLDARLVQRLRQA